MKHIASPISLVVRVTELAAIAGGFVAARWAYPVGSSTQLLIAGLAAALIYLLASELTGATADHQLLPFAAEVRHVLLAWALTLCLLLGISWSMKMPETYSRVTDGAVGLLWSHPADSCAFWCPDHDGQTAQRPSYAAGGSGGGLGSGPAMDRDRAPYSPAGNHDWLLKIYAYAVLRIKKKAAESGL